MLKSLLHGLIQFVETQALDVQRLLGVHVCEISEEVCKVKHPLDPQGTLPAAAAVAGPLAAENRSH